MYDKEGILVPENEETVGFALYQFPKIVKDDAEVFPSVARIPDAMLRKVDPTNHVLVNYLMTINPDIETRVLLKTREGPSKKK